LPADSCSGITHNPFIVDDFECQRNYSYDNGFDSLTVVANPDNTGINGSSMVGQYHKPPHQAYDALVAEKSGPFDLSTNNYVYAQVRSPISGIIKAKLENTFAGGTTKEVDVMITPAQVNQWVQCVYNFASEAGVAHDRLVFFFDAGHDTSAAPTFYIDNIKFGQAPPLEDFDATKLTWGAGDATNGTFAVVANPTPAGIDVSAHAGLYTKGTSGFGLVSASLPANFAVTTALPQMNVQVLAPAGAKTVTMQLVSALAGNKTVTANLVSAGTNTWEAVAFDYSAYTAVTDFSAINFIFDQGVAESGMKFYFDNISQSISTLNPCKGVVAVPSIANDFECQQNDTAKLLTADVNSSLTIVKNPSNTGINTSLSVGMYVKTPKSGQYDAIVLKTPGLVPYDLSVNTQVSVMIYCSTAGKPIAIKMEGGTGGLEKDTTISAAGVWKEYIVDFASVASKGNNTITLFGDLGVVPTSNDTFYFDNIKFKRAAITGCFGDFETPASKFTFTTFAGGSLDAMTILPVPNPNKSGIDTSATVGIFTRAHDGDPNFAGQYTDLGAPLNFNGKKTITMKVLMPAIGNVSLKLENSLTGAVSGDGPRVVNTKVNQWEQLTFDMSSGPTAYDLVNGQYTRLTMFFDFFIPTQRDSVHDVKYYFDDIVVGTGTCGGGVSGTNDLPIERLAIYPNPAYSDLTIDNAKDLTRVMFFNAIGQLVKTVQVSPFDTRIGMNIQDLSNGMYFIAAYKGDGTLVANAKFLKE